MIDNKKIEEAANEYSQDNCGYSYNIEKYLAFKEGANWAINEFLKDLWHPASEKPNKEGRPILFNCIDHNFVPSWCVYPLGFKGNWAIFCDSHGISKWLYINDLFPKKGDKQ